MWKIRHRALGGFLEHINDLKNDHQVFGPLCVTRSVFELRASILANPSFLNLANGSPATMVVIEYVGDYTMDDALRIKEWSESRDIQVHDAFLESASNGA